MRVLILRDVLADDARLDELDVVLQADAVAHALDELGVAHQTAPFASDVATTLATLRRAAPDVVFNLVESVAREARLAPLAPALLDSLDLSYTGCGAAGLECTASKLRARRALVRAKLPVPVAFERGALREGAAVPSGRYVIKSIWEHGSVGLESDSVVFADAPGPLLAELESRLPQLGGEGFAEGYIHGREFNVALLETAAGVRCLPPAEIRFANARADGPVVVGYRAKWHPGSAEDEATPRSFCFDAADGPLLTELRRVALDAWRACGLRGYARIDLRVDAEGQPWVVDVNPNPCLTPGSGFPATLAEAGISFAQAVRTMLTVAQRPRSQPAHVPNPTDR